MRVPRVTHVEAYVFRRRGRRVEFLCLRRSPGRRLAGVWQPVTGKIERGERALEAAAREVREETGLDGLRWWALETVSLYFDAAAGAVVALPLFAAEAPQEARVARSREHDAHAWLSARAAGARFLWEAQRRGLEAVRREVLARPRLAAALEVTPRAADGRARGRPRGAPRAGARTPPRPLTRRATLR
uniref:NUDIX domain-containing protein n=1 Tax=Eiseniibacteriota bacterium TaxID=2212470 RepID=A0A832I217_UNCEI